jgi:hypothetical protein
MQANGELDLDLLLAEAGSFHAFQYKYIVLLGVPWVVCGCLTMASPPAVPCPVPACVLRLLALPPTPAPGYGLPCPDAHGGCSAPHTTSR